MGGGGGRGAGGGVVVAAAEEGRARRMTEGGGAEGRGDLKNLITGFGSFMVAAGHPPPLFNVGRILIV